MKISKYTAEHEADVLNAISADPDWSELVADNVVGAYKRALAQSATFVCYSDEEFCGYIRAIVDSGLAVYISELYVVGKWRNHACGRTLIERVRSAYASLKVYVLSDEDGYYHKLGCERVGSVFTVHDPAS